MFMENNCIHNSSHPIPKCRIRSSILVQIGLLAVWKSGMKSSAQIITPGKVKFTTRQRHVDALKYVAKEYGPNKACSTFVVGLEPIESFLEGAEALARDGIVAMASLWIPFGRPVMGNAKAPGLDYYQKSETWSWQISTRNMELFLPVEQVSMSILTRTSGNIEKNLLNFVPA